jgi:hypothetical protein
MRPWPARALPVKPVQSTPPFRTWPRFHPPLQQYRAFAINRADVLPKVTNWATKHGVSLGIGAGSFATIRLSAIAKSAVGAKFSPTPTFYSPHVTDFFTRHEHTLTEYKLFQYKQKLADPFWIRTICTKPSEWKPVVRNAARRRLREGMRQALAEKGWTLEGRLVPSPPSQPGTQPQLRGCLHVLVYDVSVALRLDRETCVAIGREIVGGIERLQGGRERDKSDHTSRHKRKASG